MAWLFISEAWKGGFPFQCFYEKLDLMALEEQFGLETDFYILASTIILAHIESLHSVRRMEMVLKLQGNRLFRPVLVNVSVHHTEG